ncbi:hypothetical protein NL676_004709 [Syzygium grande]|nr:hypothetical protein NL676_004709 [Syzygium grande]
MNSRLRVSRATNRGHELNRSSAFGGRVPGAFRQPEPCPPALLDYKNKPSNAKQKKKKNWKCVPRERKRESRQQQRPGSSIGDAAAAEDSPTREPGVRFGGPPPGDGLRSPPPPPPPPRPPPSSAAAAAGAPPFLPAGN